MDRLYITRIHAEIDGDTFFPEIDLDDWELVSEEHHEADEKNEYGCTFEVWAQTQTRCTAATRPPPTACHFDRESSTLLLSFRPSVASGEISCRCRPSGWTNDAPFSSGRVNPAFGTRFPRGATFTIVGPHRDTDGGVRGSNKSENGTSAARGRIRTCFPGGATYSIVCPRHPVGPLKIEASNNAIDGTSTARGTYQDVVSREEPPSTLLARSILATWTFVSPTILKMAPPPHAFASAPCRTIRPASSLKPN